MGKILNVCGKKIAVGTFTATLREARAICCAMNMKLISFETVEKIFCLSKVVKDTYIGKSDISLNFWVSAGVYQGQIHSCGGDRPPVSKEAWISNKTPRPKPSQCVTALLGKVSAFDSGLQLGECGANYNVLCESDDPLAPTPSPQNANCTKPVCPVVDCDAAETSEENKSDLSISNFTSIPAKCSKKKYFFSKFEATFSQALQACCRLDMSLVSYDNLQELQCVHKKLPGNSYVWTSGTCLGCQGRFTWCGNGKDLPRKGPMWQANKPDNHRGAEHCVAVTSSWGSMNLDDANCEGPIKFVCEQSEE